MDFVQTYGNIIKKMAPEHQLAAYRAIKIGLTLEHFRTRHLADKRIPQAYRFLNSYAVKDVLEALKHPEQTAWANIFSPVEILQCFGIRTLSIESLSSFLSGFHIEDYFMDYAEAEGIAATLCSYHKNFIGAVDSGVVPPASFALTTSTICDGNISTFRHLSDRHNVPSYILDIPMEDSKEAHDYVVSQLKELISTLEERFQKKFDIDKLREILIRENESRACYEEQLKLMRTKAMPCTLTLHMYMLFATHLNIGSEGILKFFRMLLEETKQAPDFDGTNILWVHLLPWYQETLQEYMNLTEDIQIQTIEMNFDYRERLDVEHPLDALADKMINNAYTRSYSRKADLVYDLAQTLEPDGIVNFCHWGCKQSSGGVMLLKERFKDTNIPLLILDGDGMDRRNSHNGQIRTRWEAYLELIRQQKESEN